MAHSGLLRKCLTVVLGLHTGVFFAIVPQSAFGQSSTERVSVSSAGDQSNGSSWSHSAMSSDGRYVVFDSNASNLVADDGNGSTDVFVRDRLTGATQRVSVDWNGDDANGWSFFPSISADGRFVSFHSNASDLVIGDINGTVDVFVRDLATGQTELVSVDGDGVEGNDVSYFSSISADGRYVAFRSYATDLVPSDTNGFTDIFVHDRQTGETTCVTEGGDGHSYDAAISGDGRYVAFTTNAENFDPVDTNELPDVYVYDQLKGEFDLVSVDSSAVQGDGASFAPALSEHGRYVAFISWSTNLIQGDGNEARDVFVHARETDVTTRVGEYVDDFEGLGTVSISHDGRFVAFGSYGNQLVPDDSNQETDVFVHDRETAVTERVSVSTGGVQGNDYSIFPSISPDGTDVAYMSEADNLVASDSNQTSDVFVRDSWSTLVIFLDDFESGDTGEWSNGESLPESCLGNPDGSVESFFYLPAPTLNGNFVGKFTPNSYPFHITRVEVGFTQGAGTCSWLDYEVVFYDDDGPGGTPGTFLGSVPSSAAYIPQMPFAERDSVAVAVSSPELASGSIFVGAKWLGLTSRDVAIAVDESSNTPVQASYSKVDGVAGWNPMNDPDFKTFVIRACGR